MHIILAFLGVVVTILVLMNKLQENGLDIGWLNPFSWRRRRAYRLNHDLNPAFKLDSPMDVAALYMVSIAKIDGDLSKEQKERILELFQSELHLTQKDARALLSSSVYLLGQTDEVFTNPQKVIERCYDKITPEQSQSIIYLTEEIAKVESHNSDLQQRLLVKIHSACPKDKSNTW